MCSGSDDLEQTVGGENGGVDGQSLSAKEETTSGWRVVDDGPFVGWWYCAVVRGRRKDASFSTREKRE